MLETLLEAFCTWGTVSEKKPPVGPRPSEPEPSLPDGTDPGLTLSDLVTISLGRHDLLRKDRETAHSRAYQLLSFNAASSMLLVGGAQFLWERLTGVMIWIVLAMLLVLLYLSMKAIVHCLRAASTRYVADLTPLNFEDARTVLASSSGARMVAVQVLRLLEWLYRTNDRERAISAEHSGLALRTTMVYSIMVLLTLAAVAVGGSVTTHRNDDRTSRELPQATQDARSSDFHQTIQERRSTGSCAAPALAARGRGMKNRPRCDRFLEV